MRSRKITEWKVWNRIDSTLNFTVVRGRQLYLESERGVKAVSSSVVIKSTEEKGRGEIQTYNTVRIMCALLFFLQGAVLAAAFCVLQGQEPAHIALLHSFTHTTSTSHSRQTPTPLQNTSTLVLLGTMQCSQYTICVSLTSHLVRNHQHKAKKVSN